MKTIRIVRFFIRLILSLIKARMWMFVGDCCFWLKRRGEGAVRWYEERSPVRIGTVDDHAQNVFGIN